MNEQITTKSSGIRGNSEVKQFEEQFEAALSALEHDAQAASVFVYTELTLHHFFGGDFEVLDHVNPHAGFWNGVLAALQTSGLIALGRMYDRDRSDHTIHALLEFIRRHRGLFRRAVLTERVIQKGMTPEHAAQFVSGSTELNQAHIAALTQEFEALRKVYEDKVQPIRHSVFAHAGKIGKSERDALFTKVFTRELEKMVVFPLRLHRALSGLYMNGSTPRLETPPTVVTDILSDLPDDCVNTWEHRHAVKNAAAMVMWLKSAPIPADRTDKDLIARLVRVMELDQLGLREEDFDGHSPGADGSPVE